MHFERPSVGTTRRPVRSNVVAIPVQPGELHGNKARNGDTLAWVNPNTGMRFDNLTAKFVYGGQGSALVSGWFGVSKRNGDPHIQQQVVRLEHCVVTQRAEKQA